MKKKASYAPDILNVLRVAATFFVFLLHGRSYVAGINEESNPLLFLTYLPAWAGVWIFLFISSYLMGSGFITGRYVLSDRQDGRPQLKKILLFFLQRFIRLAPIYFFYCLFMELFYNPPFLWSNPALFWRVVTFTFNGDAGIEGMGHLWYLSLAMQIYLITPFIYLLLKCLRKKSTRLMCFVLALGFGLALRLVLYHFRADWYHVVYTNLFANLDFVICGMLLAFIKYDSGYSAKKSVIYGFLCGLQFVLLVLYNCYIYSTGLPVHLTIYQNVLPSLYIASATLLILQFHQPGRSRSTVKRDWKYPILHFVDWFAEYSFAFYVLHISVFVYVTRTVCQYDWYLDARLLVRYGVFFLLSFFMTLLGAVFLQYAVNGITARLKKLLPSEGGKK